MSHTIEMQVAFLRGQIADNATIGLVGVFSTDQVEPLLDALDAANAELSRLRSSPAPVVGGVPELTSAELWDIMRASPEVEDLKDALNSWFASRLPALKPGEVDQAVVEDLEHTVRFLAKQETRTHKIRAEAMILLRNGDLEGASEWIVMHWPIVQGFGNQRDLGKVGEQPCDYKRIRPAIDRLLRSAQVTPTDAGPT